jgi:hypothetical protein
MTERQELVTAKDNYELIYEEKWRRERDNLPMCIKVWKTRDGIIREHLANEALMLSIYSPRPYQLGQGCDGTTDDCVKALFILWCRANQQDPEVLMDAAYPNEAGEFNSQAQAEILDEANKEGIAIPQMWDEAAYLGLLESLRAINFRSIADIVEDMGFRG